MPAGSSALARPLPTGPPFPRQTDGQGPHAPLAPAGVGLLPPQGLGGTRSAGRLGQGGGAGVTGPQGGLGRAWEASGRRDWLGKALITGSSGDAGARGGGVRQAREGPAGWRPRARPEGRPGRVLAPCWAKRFDAAPVVTGPAGSGQEQPRQNWFRASVRRDGLGTLTGEGSMGRAPRRGGDDGSGGVLDARGGNELPERTDVVPSLSSAVGTSSVLSMAGGDRPSSLPVTAGPESQSRAGTAEDAEEASRRRASQKRADGRSAPSSMPASGCLLCAGPHYLAEGPRGPLLPAVGVGHSARGSGRPGRGAGGQEEEEEEAS